MYVVANVAVVNFFLKFRIGSKSVLRAFSDVMGHSTVACVFYLYVYVCVLVLHRRSYVFQFDLKLMLCTSLFDWFIPNVSLLYVTEPHLKCTEILDLISFFFFVIWFVLYLT